MKKEDEYKMYIFKQLDNVLRGDALRVIEDNIESPENNSYGSYRRYKKILE